MKILLAANSDTPDLFHKLGDGLFRIEICFFDNVLEICTKFHPDIILLACGCTVIPCLQTLKLLKFTHPKVPVLYVTKVSAEDLVLEAFRMGARDYIREPINIVQLKKTIYNLVKHKNTSSEKRKIAIQRTSFFMENSFEKEKDPLPPNLSKAVQFMTEKISEKIDLDKLAHQAAMSKFHFCRTFKKSTGVTPMHFLTQIRMECAKILIAEKERSLAEVALEVGYPDQSSFIKNFKKIVGMPPNTFRKNNLCFSQEEKTHT